MFAPSKSYPNYFVIVNTFTCSKKVDDLTDTIPKTEYTAAQTAIYRHNITVKIADGLEQSAVKVIDANADIATLELAAETLAVSDCLRETASPENIYHSIDQLNRKTGETFNGYDSLVAGVGTRLCPNYQAKQSRRTAKKIEKDFEENGISDEHGNLLIDDNGYLKRFGRGYRMRFITLSMPELLCSAILKLLILDRALVLFKKRKLWTEKVKGAYLNKEFTNGKAAYFRWNFHSHALVASKWIDQKQIAFHWTSCVKLACVEYDVDFPETDTKGNSIKLLNVWISDVATYATKNDKSLKDAIFEISKYMAKGSDVLKVPVGELMELNKTLSGRRMFEPYGVFNKHKGRETFEQTDEHGQPLLFWRDDVASEAMDVASTPLLDKETQLTASTTSDTPKETLIRIGTRMILDGKRKEWLAVLAKKMKERRAFRRYQLMMLNPDAIFFTLDGKRFASSDFVRPKKQNVQSFIAVAA